MVISIAMQLQPEVSFAKDSQDADNLQVVGYRSLQAALVGHLHTICAVDNARTERQLSSGLIDDGSCSVSNFF